MLRLHISLDICDHVQRGVVVISNTTSKTPFHAENTHVARWPKNETDSKLNTSSLQQRQRPYNNLSGVFPSAHSAMALPAEPKALCVAATCFEGDLQRCSQEPFDDDDDMHAPTSPFEKGAFPRSACSPTRVG